MVVNKERILYLISYYNDELITYILKSDSTALTKLGQIVVPQKISVFNIINCDDKIIIKMYNWLLTYECDKYLYQAYAI